MTDQPTGTALATQDESIPALARPRLPYHPAIEDRFGIDRGTWKVLTDNIFPTAEAPESIIAVLSYCRARKLDVLKKPVHIVQVWDKKKGAMVDTFWPSINELRITAMRTGEYVGKEATEFGPLVAMKLGPLDVEFPEWAQTTVYRFVQGRPRAFVGEKVLWLEYYAKAGRGKKEPNEMWLTKPHSQISKCSEASALRSAFPEELGNQQTSEEMEGQEVVHVAVVDNEVTSGVLSRLNGSQDAPGFSQAGVEGQAGGDKQRKPRRTKAEMEEARAEEERPTGTASVPTAEPEPDSSASATDASEGSQEATSGPTAEQPQPSGDEAEFEEVEVITEGYPADDEIYHLDGDTWGEDGRRDTYKNGLPFSSSMGKAGHLIYADHPLAFQDGPLAAQSEEDDAPVDGEFPAEFDAYIKAIEAAGDWATVKRAMSEFYNTDLFKGWNLPQQNKVRATTWEIITENKVEIPDHAQDVSAFRLWIEVQDDAEAIQGTFAVLKREPLFAQKEAAFKEAMEANVNNRLGALRG